jgi:hypothetical protein
MAFSRINSFVNNWVPKEIQTTVGGITLAATSGVAVQFLESSAKHFPSIAQNFARYSCSAALITGTVIATYSAVRLSQKIVSQESPLKKTVAATVLGCLSTALAQTISEHFYRIAPSFNWLQGHSMAYCVGTNLAWYISAFTAAAGIVFTAYTAYQLGKAVLTTIGDQRK